MPHMMISGVGRSGTKALYTALQETLLSRDPACEFYYEPYLWNLGGRQPFEAWRDKFQTTASLSVEGIYYHTTTPLFLREQGSPHSNFVEKIFDRRAGNVLAKFIRASGRLEAYLLHSDDLRVVHICRDPIATINSAIAQFSYFGDEVHPSDKPRFMDELGTRFGFVADPGVFLDEIEYSMLWWKYMNLAALDARERFGDRVLVIAHEQLVRDSQAVISRVCQFFGLSQTADLRTPSAGRPTGAVTPRSNLTREQVDRILPLHDDYWREMFPKTERIVALDVAEESEKVLERHRTSGGDAEPVCLAISPSSSPFKVRSDLLRARRKSNSGKSGKQGALKRLGRIATGKTGPDGLGRSLVSTILNKCRPRHGRPRLGKSPRPIEGSGRVRMQIREPAKITCVITSYNQSRLLEGAVYSVLRQSLPVEEILICDDGSQDESRALIAALEDEFPNVKGICREHNIGPALNRHFAILKASNPFVTQLDGDDRFHPKKLEKEWNVLEGSCEAVAFSDIAVIGPDGNSVAQDTSFFGQDVAKTQKLRSMLQRKHPVPRDMLLSKDLYVRTGGYEAGVPMYEDWSLKLRLMNLTSRWTHSGSIGTYYDRTGEGLSKRSEATRIYWQLYCIARNFDWLWNEVEPLEIAKGVQRVLCRTTKFNPRTEAALAALSEPEMNERLQRLMSTVMTAHDREPASSNAIEEAVERFSALSSELLSIGMQNEE